MSLQEQRIRKRRREKSGKFRIRVRYKYHIYKTIETEDYGSFKEMYKKYRGKYEFWCADQPPEKEDGHWTGYRLDSDISESHVAGTLKSYGRHKAWIDPTYRVDGKKVILVFNAARKRGRDPLFDPSVHKSAPFKIQSFRTNRRTRRAFPISKPTRFEQEVLDILQGDKDFYLEWQKRIAEASSEEELDALSREIYHLNRSDSAKKIILQLVNRQSDLIRRIKAK